MSAVCRCSYDLRERRAALRLLPQGVIFPKLGLESAPDVHRRVAAGVRYLGTDP
ncbi:hypothetical protein [Nonomuraea dietziae]|uniref:hypothetical protein n=1 Tax=Nonomuraea dietziae TaxID=65515 RepID=UPI0034089640